MKSILAKQVPHRSPWLPTRVRQEMQTGGKRKSARRRSIDAAVPDLSAAIAPASPRLSRPSSASPVGMAAMIGPEAPRHKASR